MTKNPLHELFEQQFRRMFPGLDIEINSQEGADCISAVLEVATEQKPLNPILQCVSTAEELQEGEAA